jgi:hypothetical protein
MLMMIEINLNYYNEYYFLCIMCYLTLNYYYHYFSFYYYYYLSIVNNSINLNLSVLIYMNYSSRKILISYKYYYDDLLNIIIISIIIINCIHFIGWFHNFLC